MSNSSRPHELQHARPPCPSPTPGVHPNSYVLSWWCHPAISSSVVPFSSCPQSLQHQSLFQWVNSLHEVAKVLEFQDETLGFSKCCLHCLTRWSVPEKIYHHTCPERGGFPKVWCRCIFDPFRYLMFIKTIVFEITWCLLKNSPPFIT